jgi:hypothetical protein
MKSAHVRAGKGAGLVLAHLYFADVESISTRDAAAMMDCETKQVTSRLQGMLIRGAMLQTYAPDGVHYSLAAGVHVEFEQDGWYRYDYLTADELASGRMDEDEYTAVKQVWVPAAGLPPPKTSAVRSVFELGQALGVR